MSRRGESDGAMSGPKDAKKMGASNIGRLRLGRSLGLLGLLNRV